MSNKKTTREQFKEMVTYLMEEGTDNSIIEGYTDTFMLIHNESQQPELRYNEEGEVDFYSNDLNTERIKKYKTVAKRYNIDEGSVRDIFSEGIYFAQYKMAQRIKEYDTFIVDLILTIGSKCLDNETLIKNGHNFCNDWKAKHFELRKNQNT